MARTSTEKQFSSASDIGQIRTSNQDFFGNKEDANLFLVADGMGGHAGGERASHLAVDTILRNYDFGEGARPSLKKIKEVLRESIRASTKAIYEEASQDRDLQQMGTTIVALVLCGPHAVLAHVGDSRIYRLRDSELEQITVDHSFVQEQIDAGIISEEDSRNHRMKNVITRALGVDSDVEVDIDVIRVRKDDVFLLCTDGLHGMASDEEILNVMLSEPDLEKCCRGLVDLANRNGGKDNVTATLVRVGEVADNRVARLATTIGASAAIVAGVVLIGYLIFSSVSKGKTPVPPAQQGVTEIPGTGSEVVVQPIPPEPGTNIATNIVEMRRKLETSTLSSNERSSLMLALATAEIQNNNPAEARKVAQDLLAFCILNDCNLRIADIQDPQVAQIITTSMTRLWTEQLQSTEERIKNLPQDQLKKYAPEEFQAVLSMVSHAKMAFKNNQLFLALSRLDETNARIDAMMQVADKSKLAKQREAEKNIENVRKELAKLDTYRGVQYGEIAKSVKSEEARIQKAEAELKKGNFDGSLAITGEVLDGSKRLLARAVQIEKDSRAAEELSRAVEKKWAYISSDEFAKVGPLVPQEAYAKLAADYEKFRTLLNAGDYKKATPLGRELTQKADSLIQDTSKALRDRIAEAEIVLMERETSSRDYEQADLARAASMLEETKLLADMQFLSQAYLKLESLEELIKNLDVKGVDTGAGAAPTEVATLPVTPKPALSPSELKDVELAVKQVDDLEKYVRQTANYLAENKPNRADDYLDKYLPEKFETLSNLIPSEMTASRQLLDEARDLCLGGAAAPAVADLEKALEKIRTLKDELDRNLAAD